MTTLLDEIKALIAEEGPITVERYMELALTHPDFGYYMNRDPFGATGDFTTSPEISQMFGELIGLWAAEVWSSMGSPRPVHLIELGPGRGTLMSDALRAARIVPEFRAALDVWLMETSPTLAAMQHELLLDCGVAVAWAQSLKEIPAGPAIVIGNEFLDALPVRQFVRVGGTMAGAHGAPQRTGRPRLRPRPTPEPYIRTNAPNGEVLEVNPAGHRFMFELGARLVNQGGAALLIDYGHSVTSLGDTLQALRAHRYVDPLAAPGDCDLTAHVDFAAMARSASATGAAVYGPIDQGDFLRAIGIDLRTKALVDRAGPERAEELQQARNRLVGKAKGEMGALFKAMAVADRKLPPPPGFQPAAAKPLSAVPFLTAGAAETPRRRPCLLHPPGRRLRRRLRLAQRRRRLARRARSGRRKPGPHGRGARPRAGPPRRALSGPFARRRRPLRALGARRATPMRRRSSRRRPASRSASPAPTAA